MLGRAEADLVFQLPFAIGLAIDRILFGDLVRAGEAEHQCPEPAGAGDQQRVLARAGHVHRRVRVLERLGVDRTRRDVDQVRVIFEVALLPHLRDHIHRLVDLRRDQLHRRVERAGFLPRAALADAEMQPALAQQVKRGDALGHLDRMVHLEGQADDAVADMDSRGAPGDEGQEALRRGQMGILRQAVMLDRPDAIEAHLLGIHALLDDVGEDLGLVRARRIHHLRFVNDRKFHVPRFPCLLRSCRCARPICVKAWREPTVRAIARIVRTDGWIDDQLTSTAQTKAS